MGIWADTFGGGNSFTESVANTFTPNDGASYVSGTLTYDSGSDAGKAVKTNSGGGFGKDDKGNALYTGSGNDSTNDDKATFTSGGINESFVNKGTAPTSFGVGDAAIAAINPISLLPKVINGLASWINGTDAETDKDREVGGIKGGVYDGRQVYVSEKGMQYSYNSLGMQYEVKVGKDGKVIDKLSMKVDTNGNLDPNGAMTGYQFNSKKAEETGDSDGAAQINQYAEDNANETGEVSGGRLTAEAIKDMADKAGIIQNQADMKAILADPDKFLSDRGLKLSDIMPKVDPNAEGTFLDPTNTGYGLGDNEGYTATSTGDAVTVAGVVQPGSETYTAEMNELTDSEMVNAVTGTVSDEAIINPEDYTIDMEGAATGINSDGTRSVLGEALNDFASQDISKVIDTSTVAGKLLAQKLGEGNYTDAKATVLGQIKIISAEFKNSQGEPVIPVWAQAMHRDASKSIAFNGISGTAATAAFSNAIMEATLGVAEKDASFFQTLTTKNLDNRQQAVINKANVLSNLEMANLDARSQAAVQNAKSFMQMDLANLDNEQQAEVVNKQALVQAMFDNTSAVNAERLFTATTENDMNKFFSELQTSVERHNSSEQNALKKFNAGEINDASQFTADIKNDRQQFLATMQYNIDISNAKWRQTVETTNNQNSVDAHTADVKSALDLTQEAQNALWDSADNLLDYIWKTTDNDMERELRLLTAQMTAQSGQSSGGGFMDGLLSLGGAFLGTSTGAKWLSSFLPSDVRLKDNIQHYDTLNGINFYTWDWNEEGKRIGANQYPSFGVLAQEIQKTHPAAVVKNADGYLRVNYGMIKNDV